jgi:acetoacetyl-CoA synthetase
MRASTRSTPPILWEPGADLLERSNLARFVAWLDAERGLSFAGYHDLWRWSVERIEDFWAAIWDHYAVSAHGPYETPLAERTMPGARWFPGAELNFAEHVFHGRDNGQVALVHASELRDQADVTWGELRSQSAAIAAGLRKLGVGRGDRVVAYMPNVPETVAAFLAVASLGAVWSSCSPDFGARAVADRFGQIEPAVLLAVDGYRYGGRDFNRLDVVARLEGEIPSLQHTVLLPYLDRHADAARLRHGLAWGDLLAGGRGAKLEFEPVPFDHPLWVLFSSGTTGLPKPLVHGHGGILLEHLKELHLHVDLRPGDRLFWFTTTGWMMWNFLVGGLLTGSAIVLYDGSPAHPDLNALWDLAERAGITCFGTSAAYIAACTKAGIEPARERDLSRLRAVGSTGSPLPPEGFDWVYEHVGRDVWLASISGGTDLCTAFVGGCPLLPVYRGELQARALGAKVEAWDEQGRSVVDEVGELVITEPMPSMPVCFWNDPDGSRYRESYFSMFPGVWRHGDWIEITSRGTAIITGRSDATINRGGVRIGTSEIYAALLPLEDVVDALVVDVPRPDGKSEIHLFVVLGGGAELTPELEREIKRCIREDCSPRHVPDAVHAAPEVPRTLSGKVLEVPIKRILMGEPPERVAARDALANPATLDWYVELAGRLRTSTHPRGPDGQGG